MNELLFSFSIIMNTALYIMHRISLYPTMLLFVVFKSGETVLDIDTCCFQWRPWLSAALYGLPTSRQGVVDFE